MNRRKFLKAAVSVAVIAALPAPRALTHNWWRNETLYVKSAEIESFEHLSAVWNSIYSDAGDLPNTIVVGDTTWKMLAELFPHE
jgi:hypothetical protein